MLVTPLMFAALAPDGDQAVQVLLRAKAGILHLTQHSSSVLSMSAQAGTLKTAKALLESNASLLMDQCDDQGYTPLHVAVENGHGDVAKMLINAGAKVTIPRKNGWTCLMSAAFFGSADIIEDLVHRGGDVNAPFVYTTQRDVTGALHHATYRPVHLAAFNGFAETISMLGKLGADVNAYMGSGWTPLMIAAAQGHTAAVGALIEMRADIDYQNPLDGVSALMTAASHGTGQHALGCCCRQRQMCTSKTIVVATHSCVLLDQPRPFCTAAFVAACKSKVQPCRRRNCTDGCSGIRIR